MIDILDQCGVISKIYELASINPETEHGALALAKKQEKAFCIVDSCSVQDIGGEIGKDVVKIPTNVSYALINVCKERSFIPVIIHSHKPDRNEMKKILFSSQDLKFMDKFVQQAINVGDIPEVLFIVTNGIGILYCIRTGEEAQYFVEYKEYTYETDKKR